MEEYKKLKVSTSLDEIIENIKACGYECVAGELSNNCDWIELKRRVTELEEIIWAYNHATFEESEAMQEVEWLIKGKNK